MRNLLNFIIKYGILLLFLTLEAVSVLLIFRQNAYQKRSILTTANSVSASILAFEQDAMDYFALKQQNAQLVQENSDLRNLLAVLHNQLEEAEIESIVNDSVEDWAKQLTDKQYIAAKVVNITTNQARNYITIDKGTDDNIGEGMGVVAHTGIVGIVKSVSKHYALVLPVLHPDFKVSCKLKKNNYLGTLVWKQRDEQHASFEDIPRHVDIANGDTILTSGRGKIFPANIPVGIIDKDNLTKQDSYHNIRVQLSVNFRTLRHVYVVFTPYLDELNELEKQTK